VRATYMRVYMVGLQRYVTIRNICD